ncbi:hypothetical protein [Virgisporangium aurantiacum]|uniref:hypothetical protein n=1 Tax=Virgisporangium aurantiacum TaxID=175570 RepID=UPI001950F25C|nr:hypothetical protein [Virgisporangium aurantiacum]
MLAEVTATGHRRQRTTAMTRVVERASTTALDEPDDVRVMPLASELLQLVSLAWPGGLKRGATVVASGATSLLFALLAEPMAKGAWAAIVGAPELGVAAAPEYGIDLARLALVPQPGDRWAEVVAALIDGFDMVIVAPPAGIPARLASSLMARTRQRGCVLIPTGPWPGSDLTLKVVERRWRGVGRGRGRLRLQEAVVEAVGRGRAERPRRAAMALPPQSVAQRSSG